LCAVVDVGWSQDVGRLSSSHILRNFEDNLIEIVLFFSVAQAKGLSL
jgi:hypothetical protein